MGDDRLGRKEGAAVPLSEEELDPYLTLSPGPRPTSVPSGILIHLAVWSQQTMVENWGCVPLFFWGGGAGTHLTQCGRGRGLPLCQVSS